MEPRGPAWGRRRCCRPPSPGRVPFFSERCGRSSGRSVWSARRKKQKARVFGLGADVEDGQEADEDARTPSGMRGIEGVEKLRAAYRRHPAAFSKSIEEKMARVLDEYPGETGATPAAMLAVRCVTTFMPMGMQQAVGRMCYSLARIHLALVREEFAEAKFLTLITLVC